MMVEFRPTRSHQSAAIPILKANPAADIARGVAAVAGAVAGAGMDERRLDERQRQVDHEVEMAELRRRRQAEVADAAGRYAEMQGQIGTMMDELRISPDAKPGAVGHTDAARVKVQERIAAFRQTLSNDEEVQNQFGPMLARLAAETERRERAFEMAETGKHQGNQWKIYSDAQMVALQRNPTLDQLNKALEESTGLIDAMGIPATARAAVLDATHKSYVKTALDAQIAGGQQSANAVKQILDAGHLDQFLTAEDRENYFGRIDRTNERARIEAERAEADARRTAKQTVDALETMLKLGATPSDVEMQAGRDAAKLLPPAEQVSFAALDVQRNVNRMTLDKDAATIRHDRDLLRAKVRSGRATQSDELYLRAYDQRLETQMDAEAEDGRTQLGEGPAGRIARVEQSMQMDAATRFETLERMERGLGHASLLPTPSSRRMAIEGRAIRKAQPDLVVAKEARAAFRLSVGSVAGLLGEQFDDKLGIAMDLYAHDMSRRASKEFNPNLFAQYVNISLGATKRADGAWQGGLALVNGRKTIIPDRLSPDEFRTTIARSDWSAARDTAGQPVAKDFIINHMVPVLADEQPDHSSYYFQDSSGGYLMAENGRRLMLKMRNGIGR